VEEVRLEWQFIENSEHKFNHGMFGYWCNFLCLKKTNLIFFRCTMIQLRHEHKASLKSDNLEFFYENPQNPVFAYSRYNNDRTDHGIIIINWSSQSFTNDCVPNVPVVKGQWTEWLS
jgi:hypothetical protein